jgi:hypothetical protein
VNLPVDTGEDWDDELESMEIDDGPQRRPGDVALAGVLSTNGERKKKTSSSFSPEMVSGPAGSWAKLVGHRQVSASPFFSVMFSFFFFLFPVFEILI